MSKREQPPKPKNVSKGFWDNAYPEDEDSWDVPSTEDANDTAERLLKEKGIKL